MTPAEDRLDNIEHCLERARCAGNQEAIHILTTQRAVTIAEINNQRTR